MFLPNLKSVASFSSVPVGVRDVTVRKSVSDFL